MSERILVTGGAGFVGTHLCARLVGEGSRVVCIDNFSSGSQKNLTLSRGKPNFSILERDVIHPLIDLEASNNSFTQIYNLACPASPPFYQADPIQTMRTNVFGAYNVLELARRCGATVLQASTSEIYGDPLVHPQSESYWGNVNPCGLRSCYDEGKRAAEALFFDFRRSHNTNVKVVRIFNTYGPFMSPNDGRVVSNFIVQALRGDDLTVYGDGSQTRSLCYVDDLIEAISRMMNSSEQICGPINLGNPLEFTMLDLAEKVIRLVGSKSKVSFRSLPADDPRQRQPNIDLAKSALGWSPKVSLEDGLRETIAYFRRLAL